MASAAPNQKTAARKLQPLRELVLRAVIAKNVKVLNDAIVVFEANKVLFSDDTSKPFQLFDFFPEYTSVKVQKQYHSHSPLMIACEDKQEDIVMLLIENGASVALKNKYGLTAVHVACRHGELGMLHSLLTVAKEQRFVGVGKSKPQSSSDCEAALMTRAKKGWYPVMYAVKGGHVELVKECFKECDLHNVKTKKKKTLLHIAAKAAQLPCMEEVMTDDIKRATDKKGWNVFHHACASGDIEVVKWLTEKMGPELYTELLRQKSKCGQIPLMTACEYKKTDVVKYLLGLNVTEVVHPSAEAATERRRTALHIASAHNATDIVGLLIDEGCPVSVQDKNGETALHYAFRSSSTEVIEMLEDKRESGKILKDIKNDAGKLPRDVRKKDLIPLEIRRRGEDAIKIYKQVLKKGKKKIPRCNLLILGEEHVGKTSLYRLLVRKGFNKHQESTRGIDDNEVDTVDERSISMGDEDWEEKPKEDQKESIKRTYIESMGDALHETLPSVESKQKPDEPDKILTDEKLKEMLENIKRELQVLPEEPVTVNEHQSRHPSQQPVAKLQPISSRSTAARSVTTRGVKAEYPAVAKEQKVRRTAQFTQSSVSRDHEDNLKPPLKDVKQSVTPTAPASKQPASESTAEPLPVDAKPKREETDAPSISRRESEILNKKIREKKKHLSDDGNKQLKLELKALDFAGQKQYRPMHHCFITRRAIYLVVFNLQKMIEHIEKEEKGSLITQVTDGNVPNSPIEQIRYWLYSIHAHIFPPEESDYMRRVCLVGTHKCPELEQRISDDMLKKIDKRLTKEFKSDGRCVNLFHFMKSDMIFAAVENSKDGGNKEARIESGAAGLQLELKLVSQQLEFLKEDHPLIWLRFEEKLIRMRQELSKSGAPLFVTEKEVRAIATSQGIDDDQSYELALHFFHDTGKLVWLKHVPSLFLDDDEKCELADLIILDPAWLIKVMRDIVELNPKSGEYKRDRMPANKLADEGVASKDLLLELWKTFLPEDSNRDKTFRHLCTILKAYCLVYPLNESIMSIGDASGNDEVTMPSPRVTKSVEVTAPKAKPEELFLVPCMLPAKPEDKRESSKLPWVTFYFDFKKFLPEVIYHRFICLLLAKYQSPSSNNRTPPQFSETWCRFNGINECNWKVEILRDVHRLKISVLTRKMSDFHQHIFYIHGDYLSQICERSEFQGLKYHGGPIATCECDSSEKVLPYVSFTKDEIESEQVPSKLTLNHTCDECFSERNIENLLSCQINHRGVAKKVDTEEQVHSCIAPLTRLSISSTTEDIDAGLRLTDKHLPALIKQLKKHASKWRNIGIHLGFLPGELSNIAAHPTVMQGGPVSLLGALLEEWIQWAPGDSRGSTSFATLNSLKASLRDTGLGAAAHDLNIE